MPRRSGTGCISFVGKFCQWSICVRLGWRGLMRFMPFFAMGLTSVFSIPRLNRVYAANLRMQKRGVSAALRLSTKTS